MRKIKRDKQVRYPLVRLYKNDLDDLIAVFEKNCKEVELKADGYELEDVSQLKNIDKLKITELTINGRLEEHSYFDSIRLTLGKKIAYVSIGDDENITYLGMVSQIKSILRRRAKIRAFLASYITFFIFIAFILILNIIDISLRLDKTYKLIYNQFEIYFWDILTFLIAIQIFYCIWLFYIKKAKLSLIFLVNEDKMPNFFKRNSDEILLNTFFTFLGAALALLIAWLTSHLH